LGYYFLPEGRQLFLDISNIINKKRYTTSKFLINLDKTIDNIIDRSEIIFSKNPPFDINSGKTHTELAQDFRREKRKLSPNIVYVYKNNKLIEGSPFLKYSEANKALGLNPSSNTCNRYIDTGKLYKKQYLFSSKLISLNDK
jgi:hypothetical protein